MINKDEGNNVVPTCNEKFIVKQNLFVFWICIHFQLEIKEPQKQDLSGKLLIIMQEDLFKLFYANNVPLMKEHSVIRLVLSSIAYVLLGNMT